jgi:hypothetical protein
MCDRILLAVEENIFIISFQLFIAAASSYHTAERIIPQSIPMSKGVGLTKGPR